MVTVSVFPRSAFAGETELMLGVATVNPFTINNCPSEIVLKLTKYAPNAAEGGIVIDAIICVALVRVSEFVINALEVPCPKNVMVLLPCKKLVLVPVMVTFKVCPLVPIDGEIVNDFAPAFETLNDPIKNIPPSSES